MVTQCIKSSLRAKHFRYTLQRIGSYGTTENNYASSSKELDVLTGKRIIFIVYLFLWCYSNKPFAKKEAFYLKL